MCVVLGLDIGTTTITALALDAKSGQTIAFHSVANKTQVIKPSTDPQGRSEWDAVLILQRAADCLRNVAQELGDRVSDVSGLGITGQQHGVVLVDQDLHCVTSYINWQDRRGEMSASDLDGNHDTFIDFALGLIGTDTQQRHGCQLATGYMGCTLAWLHHYDCLPSGENTAAFIMDYVAATFAASKIVSSPSSAASSGIFDVHQQAWNLNAINALGLSSDIFPAIGKATDVLGGLSEEWATTMHLPEGIPVFVACGDNQASFVGTVTDSKTQLLINVGTGGQVAMFSETAVDHPDLEVRPFPLGGYLLVNAGLCGGRSFAELERFFAATLRDFTGSAPSDDLFHQMCELANAVPAGSDGLRCSPLFTGTRSRPELRASWEHVGLDNFTAGHLVRALLEGMARVFSDGYAMMKEVTGCEMTHIVGAGNGLRKNALLRECVELELQLPLQIAAAREEACIGAAMIAAIGLQIDR
jgi:sugar (pentulose or hexulose) kinase|tara:strand:+ start:3305 stop:4720 length:1416 start_codon:yes stop_codon:yes gene_type:complete